MEVIKYIILILIFICSTFIGILFSRKFKDRVKELKELKNVINILETKIKFTYKPLAEIFSEIVKLTEEKQIAKIFQNTMENLHNRDITSSWEKAIDDTKAQLSLNKEDISILKNLGKLLR